MRTISIIIPALNEAGAIREVLTHLQPMQALGAEVVVVDGGSADDTMTIAASLCNFVERAPRGRASQMNAGAARASGSILLFLHADTRLPPSAIELVFDALRGGDQVWGRFDVRIESPNPVLWLIARMMNLRSRWSGIATGDQAIFVRRADFNRIGGFRDIPIMEDIALSRALRRLSKPACIRVPVITSARRWEQHGIMRTIFLMWRLRLAYFRGADPADLARAYGYGPSHD